MDNAGVLVGWLRHDLDPNLMVTLQTISRPDAPGDVDVLRLMMTKDQAAVLANDLFMAAGQSPPDPKERGWLRRMFG